MWFEEARKTKAPSLTRTLLKRHYHTLMRLCLLHNLEAITRGITPFFVARVASYFDPSVEMDLHTALTWSVGLALLLSARTMFRSYVYYRINRFGSTLRLGVSGLIYRKACRITQREISKRSIGLIVNLITNDAQRLEEQIDCISVFMNIWVATGLYFVLMYYELGLYVALAALATLLLFVPIQINLSKLVVFLREKASTLTDNRIKCIHEMVMFIRVIKMYSWEIMFRNLVEKIRRNEAKCIGLFIMTEGILTSFYYVCVVLALLVIITLKVYIKEPMTSSQVFFFLSVIGLLRLYIPLFLGRGLMYVSQLMISFKRIEDFLNADEVSHLDRKDAILNLSNEVILNKNFLRDECLHDIHIL